MDIENRLKELFLKHFGLEPTNATLILQSGSNRVYYRLQNANNTAIGTYGKDFNENQAFFYITDLMHQLKFNVPEIYAISEDKHFYLQEDIGNKDLFSLISVAQASNQNYNQEIDKYLRMSISELVRLQREMPNLIDFKKCYPYQEFGKDSILYDLRYFMFYFAKIFDLNYDELELEKEFQSFADELTSTDYSNFLYRDFQSRNILIKDGDVYFIDYQAGRRGAPHYDLASLLFQARAKLPGEKRAELLEYYMDCAEISSEDDRRNFAEKYYKFVCIRLLQTLGAYGLRGIIEQKAHFIQSIIPAVNNLKQNIYLFDLKENYPLLYSVLQQVCEIEELQAKEHEKSQKLKITVYSFSYKKGSLRDYSGNGGGYQFDCRGLENPGRIDKYKKLTGMDLPVIEYLKTMSKAEEFVNQLFELVKHSIDTYLERKFTNLMIGFGCTGGQHRSVFCAEELAKRISEFYKNRDIELIILHKEQGVSKSISV